MSISNDLIYLSDFDLNNKLYGIKQDIRSVYKTWRKTGDNNFKTMGQELETDMCYLQREIECRKARIVAHEKYLEKLGKEKLSKRKN